MIKRILWLILVSFCAAGLVTPVFAHGEEPDEEATVVPDDHAEDADDTHAEEEATVVPDDHAEDADDTHAEEEATVVPDDHAEDADDTHAEEEATVVPDDHAEDVDDTHAENEATDDHAEDTTDAHADEADDHGGGSNLNTLATVGGIIGAIVLVAGAMMILNPSPSSLVLAGLALIGFTGVLHLVVGAAWSDTLLILNGLGYMGLAIAWVWPQQFIPNQNKIVAAILIVYTLITIVGYFGTHDHYDYTAILSKIVEVVLILVLGLSFRPNISSVAD